MSTKKTIKIDGMHCDHCRKAVENALNSLDGVSAKVSLSKKEATLKITSDVTDEQIASVVSEAGFTVIE